MTKYVVRSKHSYTEDKKIRVITKEKSLKGYKTKKKAQSIAKMLKDKYGVRGITIKKLV